MPPMTAEEKLAAALKEFDEATSAFRRTRCYSHKVFVDMATKRLLDASDAVFAEKRNQKDAQ